MTAEPSPVAGLPALMQRTPLTIGLIFERLRTIYADGRLHDPAGTTTYAAFADRVLRLARALTDELGVQPGDRVASFATNTVRHLELYYAVPLVGAVLHTVNIRLFDEQIAWMIAHAGDEVVFVDGDLTDRLATIRGELTGVRRFVRLGPGPDDGLPSLTDHDELVAAHEPAETLPELDEHAALGLCYTSGTTGQPKGVLTSHRAMVLHAFATCMADHIGLRERDVVLPIVPMFHAFGWGLPYAAPFTGAELSFHGGDNRAAHLADTIVRDRVTVAAAVPTIWRDVLPQLETTPAATDTLRLVFVGGAASPRSLIAAYEQLGVEYLQVWGMTETGPLAAAARPRRRHLDLDPDAQLDVRANTGTIFAGLEARVTDDHGEPVPWDGASVGELEVRGPWIASGYLGVDAADRFHDGWLRTGDLATIEHDGLLRIVDRAKDLVKSGGEWISSVELENHLVAHPDILEAAVVGVSSRRWDERPVAVVVPRDPAAPPSLETLHAFLAERVARWWLPDRVELVAALPKTGVGKLDKRTIRSQLAALELD